jgi:hypothetical protein
MAPAPLTILVNSPSATANPFIFQLPATSGLNAPDAMMKSFSACGYQSWHADARAGRRQADPS